MISIYDFIERNISPIQSPIIFELGANLGQDTIKIYNLLKNPQYYGFEPDPDHWKILENLSIYNQIHLFPFAIGKENTTALFHQAYVGEENSGSSSLLQPKNHLKHFPHVKFPEDKKIEVIVRSLDSITHDLNVDHIDFIWADIQGAEGDMILGGQKILRKTKYLFTEYCNDEFYQGQKTLKQLLNLLPGKWEIVEDYKSDVLLENLEYGL